MGIIKWIMKLFKKNHSDNAAPNGSPKNIINKETMIGGSNNDQAGRDINKTYNNIYNNTYSAKVRLLESAPKPDEDSVDRKEKYNLLNEIKNNNVIKVYGISGIGKSELVKEALSEERNRKVYWISCEDEFDEKVDLSYISTILGNNINIIETLQSKEIVLVIDNYNQEIKDICTQFLNNNKKQSKLIITAKEKSEYNEVDNFFLDYMTLEEAKKIFTEEIFQNREFEEFLKKIDRHPMTLKVLRNYLTSENGISFSDINQELDSLVRLQDMEISSSKKICEKIIGVYYRKSPGLYKFLSLFDSNILESEFLKNVMISDISVLVNRCFIKFEGKYYYMHSIIRDSIKSVVAKDSISMQEISIYTDKVLEYLKNKIEIRDLNFYRFCGYNIRLLENLFRVINDNYYKIVIYNAYIVVKNYHNKEDMISEIDKLLQCSSLKEYYEVKLLLEKYELEISCTNKEKKEEKILEKVEDLNQRIKQYTDYNIKQLLKQRIGKFYNWNQNYLEAIKILEPIVRSDDKSYSAILQLFRAYKSEISKDYTTKAQYIDKINTILEKIDFQKMPISIFLEIIKLIIYRPLNEEELLKKCLWDNFEKFNDCVKLYSENNIHEHIYIIIGNLASNLYFNKKDIYKEWFENIEHPNIKKCDKTLLKAMIDINCYEVKRRVQAGEEIGDILDKVIDYWNYYKESYWHKNKFLYKSSIDCFISVGELDRAENELNEIYDDKDIWHIRYKSQIEEGRDDLSNALKHIEKVIEEYSKKEGAFEGHIKTFESDKERILKKISDSEDKRL